MRNTIALIAASAAPLASATLLTYSQGGALIKNLCPYDIPLQNIPAIGAGVENAVSDSCSLDAHTGTKSYPWVQLNVAGGWSMKLDVNNDTTVPMQFEYTAKGDNLIWYDMSFVNGQYANGKQASFPPFCFYTSPSDTVCKHNAYMAWNDDANGMQVPVPTASTVTLVVCDPKGTPIGDYSAPTATGSAPTTTQAPSTLTTTTAAPAYTAPSSSKTTTTTTSATVAANKNAATTTSVAPAPASSSSSDEVETITEYATQVVTAFVTETAHAYSKRHAHRHPHGHKH